MLQQVRFMLDIDCLFFVTATTSVVKIHFSERLDTLTLYLLIFEK